MNKVIELFDHIESLVRINIPLSKSVCNFSMPGFTSNQFWVDVIVGDNVHVVPPSVDKIMVPLMVHAHLDKIHSWEMASSSMRDHLTVIHNSHISSTHSIKVLIIFIVNKDNFTVPWVLSEIFTSILFTFTTFVK